MLTGHERLNRVREKRPAQQPSHIAEHNWIDIIFSVESVQFILDSKKPFSLPAQRAIIVFLLASFSFNIKSVFLCLLSIMSTCLCLKKLKKRNFQLLFIFCLSTVVILSLYLRFRYPQLKSHRNFVLGPK